MEKLAAECTKLDASDIGSKEDGSRGAEASPMFKDITTLQKPSVRRK